MIFAQYLFHDKGLDANRYATKQTIALGMMDVALLTANASQLKHVLQEGAATHPFYYLMLTCIIISMILQVSPSHGFLSKPQTECAPIQPLGTTIIV